METAPGQACAEAGKATASDTDFRCTKCNKRFSKRDHLQRHIRSHTGEKPYECDICHKLFARKDVYQKHRKLHLRTSEDSQEKPEVANKNFTTADPVTIPPPTASLELIEQAGTYASSLTSMDSTDGATFSTWNMNNDYPHGAAAALLSTDDFGLTWQPPASGESWDDLWPFLLDSSLTTSAPDDNQTILSTDESYLMKLWLSRPRVYIESVEHATPYTSQSRVTISPEFYQALCTFLCNNLQSMSNTVDWGQLAMQQSLDYFFESACFPLLHSPTFTVEEGGILVVGACIALGAYSRDTSGYGTWAVSLGTAILRALYNMQIPVLPPPPYCPEQTPLQICQASLLCSHLALLSGDRGLLLSAQLFQATLSETATRRGLCNVDRGTATIASLKWESWIVSEVWKRTIYAIAQLDRTWAQLYLLPPVYDSGALVLPLPCTNSLWTAESSIKWQQEALLSNHATATRTRPFADISGMLLHHPVDTVVSLQDLRDDPFACDLLISSLFGVVLGTVKIKPRILTMQALELKPLETALNAAYCLVSKAQHADPYFTGILWNVAWLHLACNMRLIEVACGREGRPAILQANEKLAEWVKSPLARKGVLHAIDIFGRVSRISMGTVLPPQIQVSALQAWMYMFAYSRLQPTDDGATITKPIDWTTLNDISVFGEIYPFQSSSLETDFLLGKQELKLSRVLTDMHSIMSRMGNSGLTSQIVEMITAIRQLFRVAI